MELEFAPAGPECAAELARIGRDSFDDPWPERAFRAELRREWCEALVARPLGGDIAGYVLGWRVLDEVQILSLAVDPAWRGRGVGSRLLRSYLERLRRGDTRRVSLEVRASNAAAQQLYSRLGLHERGSRARYYPGGETALLFGAEL